MKRHYFLKNQLLRVSNLDWRMVGNKLMKLIKEMNCNYRYTL
jgi:hypothetical protein